PTCWRQRVALPKVSERLRNIWARLTSLPASLSIAGASLDSSPWGLCLPRRCLMERLDPTAGCREVYVIEGYARGSSMAYGPQSSHQAYSVATQLPYVVIAHLPPPRADVARAARRQRTPARHGRLEWLRQRRHAGP